MSYYEVLLFLHVGGAIIWLGSSFLMQMLFYRAKATANFALVEGMSMNTQWLAQRVFIPTSFAVLVLGILLTIEGPWSFDMLWIVLALIAFATTFALGIGVIEPEGKKLGAASAQGPEHPEVVWRSRRMDALMKLDLVLLWVVVLDMTVKPTGDDVVALVIMAGALLLAGGYAVNVLRAPGPAAAAAPSPAASSAD
jgi:predicted permease